MTRSKLALCFSALGALAACQKKATAVKFDDKGTVQRGNLTQRVTFAGNIVPNRKAIVTAPYNGYIKNIHVKLGQYVKRDQPILSFSQSLRGVEEENYPLRAPFDGLVVQVLKSEGEYVESGAANGILRIDDMQRLFIDANVPEMDVVKLKVGQETRIRNSSGGSRVYRGLIRNISLAALEKREWERARVEFPIRIEIINPDEALKPGMTTMVEVVTQESKNVLFVRHEFIERDGEDAFLLGPQGQKRKVTLGLQNEEAAVIVDGAQEGEVVKQVDFLKLNPDG